MKYTDINRRCTEIIAEYLAKGYTINTGTMCGSQGEKAHIDLTDGDKVIRILVQDFRDYDKGCEGTEIIIGENGSDWVKPNAYRERGTVWNDKLAVILTERFYTLGEDKKTGEPFYGTAEEGQTAAERRMAHYHNNPRHDNGITEFPLEGRRLEIARNIVKERMGIKRILNDDIKLKKSSGGYYITYRGKKLALR